MKKLLFYLLLFTSFNLSAQITMQWRNSIGGVWSDHAYSISQTLDEGYIVAGYAYTDGSSSSGDLGGCNGHYEAWIVKLDVLGDIVWQNCLGGSNYDYAYSIQQTNDGGYVFAGSSGSNNGAVSGNNGGAPCVFTIDMVDTYGDGWNGASIDVIINGVLTNYGMLNGSNAAYTFTLNHGDTWDIVFNPGTYDNEIIYTFTDCNGSEIFTDGGGWNPNPMVGTVFTSTYENPSYDYWVVKLDSSGNIAWQKCLGGSGAEAASSIQQTADGGYIVAGNSSSNDGDVSSNNGATDYWIVKLDALGNIAWQKCLGGSGAEAASSIQQTADGGYIVAGNSSSNDGDVSSNNGATDYWIVKLDALGNISWQKSLGGSSSDKANSITQTIDGGYIVAGESSSNDGNVTGNNGSMDYWIVKLDPSGNIAWQKSLGGSDYEAAKSIQQTTDGGYIIAGSTNSSNDGDVGCCNYGGYDYWIVKLDASGSLIWENNYGGGQNEWASSIQQIMDDSYIIVGSTNTHLNYDVGYNNGGNFGKYDYWIVKLGPYIGINEDHNSLVQLFPNPSNDIITLTLAQHSNGQIILTDILGKEVLSKSFTSNEVQLNLKSLESKGTYFAKVLDSDGNVIAIKKLIYQ